MEILYSNNTRIVRYPFDSAALEEIAKALQVNAKTLLNKDVELPVIEGGLYPYIENKSKLKFEDLVTISKPTYEIRVRAFENTETISLPKKQVKEFEHTLTREEKEELANKMCDDLEAKDKVEDEKTKAVAAYNKQINELDARISLNGAAHKRGVETRKVEVTVELDFDKKTKIYKDAEGKTVLTEDLDELDFQMKLDLTSDMFKEDDVNVFTHPRLEELREKIAATEGKIVIKKDKDDSDFPHVLKINDDAFGYTTSKLRDADYTLARKVFVKATMKVVKDEPVVEVPPVKEDEIRVGLKDQPGVDWEQHKRPVGMDADNPR